jgi:glycyl-tRNA synthetase alpha chain
VFNILDARGAISVTERAAYIAKVRKLAILCAKGWLEQREEMGFPLLQVSGESAG